MLVSDAPPTLDQALSGSQRIVEERQLESGISGLRLGALKAVALSYGTQAGYARRAFEIRQEVQAQTAHLNKVYDFEGLILERNVLPPVLVEATNTLAMTGSDTLRLSDHTYQVVTQARFVTAAPTWRDYLITGVSMTWAQPDLSLTPRDANEQRYWEAQVKAGWAAGVQQADQVFQAQLSRLTRDYKGMVLYRHLLTRNMVSKPFVAESNLGVTGDGSQISINDRILRITALPQLETRSEQWKAKLVPSRATSANK